MNAAIHTVPSLAATYRRMVQAAGPHAPEFKRSMGLFALAAVCQGLAFAMFYPLLAALMTDPADINGALFWLLVMAGFAAGDLLLNWWGYRFDYCGVIAHVMHDLRLRLGAQLRRMPMEALLSRRAGDLNAVLAGNIDDVVTPMGVLSHLIIRTLITPGVIIAVTFLVDWRMALALAAIFPMALPIYRWQRTVSGKDRRHSALAHGQVEAELIEYTQGLPILRTLGRTGAQAKRLQDALAELRRVQRDGLTRGLWPGLLMASLVEIGLLAVLALGLVWVLYGSFAPAAFAALLVIAVRFSEPLALFSELTKAYDLMEAGFVRMEEVTSISPLPVRTPAEKPNGSDIDFDNVSFSYAGQDMPALSDVSFHLPARSLTALVGPSGSGKTTLTRLLLRYADPQVGTVRIGQADIRTLSQADLMALVSVVFQDVYLFDDSILENIRLGRAGASDDEVIAAARLANCHEFISRLPAGYQTRVGDIGGRLSGGERQRISIARAILKAP